MVRVPMGRASKYGNTPVSLDDRHFGSQAEARRWYQLQVLEKAGQIKGLRFHPRYRLLADFEDRDGVRVQGIVYEADAAYVQGEVEVVEDTKGAWTGVFMIKRKWFMSLYPTLHLRIIPAGEV